MEGAFFVEDHCRHRRNRLGHRKDVEQGVFVEGPVVVEPVTARRLEMHDLPVSGDHRDGARQPARQDFTIHKLGDFAESGAGKTDRLWIEVGPLFRLQWRDQQQEASQHGGVHRLNLTEHRQ